MERAANWQPGITFCYLRLVGLYRSKDYTVEAMKALVLSLLLVAATPSFAGSLFYNGAPISLHVTGIRSISPEQRIGFGKSDELYAVDAYSTVSVGDWVSGPQTSFVLYCLKAAPEAGRTYTARDEYISAQYTDLRLWPIEKSTIGAGRGRLYRIVQIRNVFPGKHPDLGCDVYSAKDLK